MGGKLSLEGWLGKFWCEGSRGEGQCTLSGHNSRGSPAVEACRAAPSGFVRLILLASGFVVVIFKLGKASIC